MTNKIKIYTHIYLNTRGCTHTFDTSEKENKQTNRHKTQSTRIFSISESIDQRSEKPNAMC